MCLLCNFQFQVLLNSITYGSTYKIQSVHLTYYNHKYLLMEYFLLASLYILYL